MGSGAQDPRLEIHYVLSRPSNPGAWTCGSTGRVCEEMLRRHLFPPGPDALALMCGPPGMQDASMAHLWRGATTRRASSSSRPASGLCWLSAAWYAGTSCAMRWWPFWHWIWVLL